MLRPIVIAAGGTGGHLFPAEALAASLIARNRRIVLMTDGRSAALNSDVFGGRERYVISGAGISGHGPRRAAAAMLALARGIAEARAILKNLDASCVVGFGGYPSVPPILAARLLRRRPVTVLHEQNAVLGRANRFLARRADFLALGFADARGVPNGILTAVTGNPVRPAIERLAGRRYELPAAMFQLLVLGGSLGARVFSDVVPGAVAMLPEALRHRLRVTQQCRAEDLERVRLDYAACGVEAELAPFFTDVAARLARAHLMIGRAGASTCAELAVAGMPSILVPLPGAIDDHQSANAAALARAGGARIIPQAALSPATLAASLGEFLGEPRLLADAARAAASCAVPHAADRLADLVEQQLERVA